MTVSGMKVQSCMERLHQRNEELVFHVHISYYKCLQIIITLYELYLHISKLGILLAWNPICTLLHRPLVGILCIPKT